MRASSSCYCTIRHPAHATNTRHNVVHSTLYNAHTPTHTRSPASVPFRARTHVNAFLDLVSITMFCIPQGFYVKTIVIDWAIAHTLRTHCAHIRSVRAAVM